MANKSTAVLLMNVGSPDEPRIFRVWKYLTLFLNDKHVIDLPWLLRKFLVNFIIIPFRVKKSTGLYKRLWTSRGSPLIHYTEKLRKKLEAKPGTDYKIFTGMRYGNPGYKKALKEIKKGGYTRLVIFPLFPQYAMSTTGTALEAVEKEVRRQRMEVELYPVEQFYDHPRFIAAFAEQARKNGLRKYDHVVFSYHGLPNRQLERIHPGIRVQECNCATSLPEHGKHCYRATCYATTRLLAGKLGLQKKDYSVAFQSRLSRNWLSPFTDDVILEKLKKEGHKKILVLAPAFVTDCLETLVEIGEDYSQMFQNAGGEKLQLVEGLNATSLWMEAMEEIIRDTLRKGPGKKAFTNGTFWKQRR